MRDQMATQVGLDTWPEGGQDCAFYAQAVLQRYLGPAFQGNRVLELGIVTPRAVERALRHHLKEESIDSREIHFKEDLRHMWRQLSRNMCESAILDPIHAVRF